MPERRARDPRLGIIHEGAHSQQLALSWAQPSPLRRHFIARYGRPDSTFVTGHSMGGLITLATIEGRPRDYHGALPLCGVLSPSLEWMRTMFDLLVSFDYLYPGVLTTSPLGMHQAQLIRRYVMRQQVLARARASG